MQRPGATGFTGHQRTAAQQQAALEVRPVHPRPTAMPDFPDPTFSGTQVTIGIGRPSQLQSAVDACIAAATADAPGFQARGQSAALSTRPAGQRSQ